MVSGAAPRIAPDVAHTPGYADLVAAVPIAVGAYVGTPIATPDGELFGTVCGLDPHAQPEEMTELQPLLDLLSSLLSAVLAGDLHATAAARELELARREADLDVLTGLLNRRGWDRYIQVEEERFRKFGDLACVVVLDLDHLKIVNDTRGHEAGDRYIQRAAQVLAEVVRQGDVARPPRWRRVRHRRRGGHGGAGERHGAAGRPGHAVVRGRGLVRVRPVQRRQWLPRRVGGGRPGDVRAEAPTPRPPRRVASLPYSPRFAGFPA